MGCVPISPVPFRGSYFTTGLHPPELRPNGSPIACTTGGSIEFHLLSLSHSFIALARLVAHTCYFPRSAFAARHPCLQVGSAAQEHHARLLPCYTGINHAVTRR